MNCIVLLQFKTCFDLHCAAFFLDGPQSPQNRRNTTYGINSLCQFRTIPASEQPGQRQKLYCLPAASLYPSIYLQICIYIFFSIFMKHKIVNISWEVTGETFKIHPLLKPFKVSGNINTVNLSILHKTKFLSAEKKNGHKKASLHNFKNPWRQYP